MLILAGGLLLAPGGMSHAQESQPPPRIVRGEIVSVDGPSLTVQTATGGETLALADDVRIIAGKRLLTATQLRPGQRVICEVADTPQDATARLVLVLGSAPEGEQGVTIQGIAQAAEGGEPINLSNSDSDSTYPAVAVGADGRVHVVWAEGPPDSACDIAYTYWDGQTWAAPTLVTTTAGLSWAPQVAVDLTGTVHVVWTESVNYVPRILYSRLEEGGGWSTPVILSGELTDSYFPDIVADSEGHLHVAWEDLPPYQNPTVRYVTGNGGEWSQPEIVADQAGSPALATGPDNILHLVWIGGWDDVYHRQRVAGVWGAPEVVCEGDECGAVGPGAGEPYLSETGVAVAPDGTLHVAWRRAETNDNGDNIGEIFHRWRAEGGQWSEVSNVSQSTNHSYGLSLVADELGRAHAVWYELGYEGEFLSHLPGDHDPGVRYRIWRDGAWGESHYLFTSILILSAYGSSDAAVDETSQVHVVWNEWTGNHTDIFYTSESSPGLWVEVSVSPSTTLSLTAEGWPTPNPLEVTVTVGNNLTTTVNVSGTLTLGGTPPPRFYIIADDEGNAGEDFSQNTYLDDFTVNLTPSSTQMFTWTVWVQPSEATTLQATAELNVVGTPQDTAGVTIPQASIHPVVFLHGILGSMPPRDSVITQWPQNLLGSPTTEGYLDPFTDSYAPLIENLMKMGYELDRTLFPMTYDWRQSNQASASYLGWVLDERVPNHVNTVSYAVHDGQADVIVHSMGGMVLRAYLEDLADDPQYRGLDHVNKAVFIASPHRGFPIAYRTWEGLTWEEYLNKEIDPVSNAVPPEFYHWITSTFSIELPFRINTLHLAMDNLLWPYMILKRYEPQAYEPCWLPDPDIPLIPEFVEHNLSLLVASTECHLLAWPALHTFSHDPIWGIRSLPEMLPEVGVSPPYLRGWAPLPLPPGTKDYPWCGTWHGVPDPCSSDGRQTNLLLETHGLNDPANVSTFVSRVGDQNIYVLYNSEEPTPYTYDDLLVPVRTPEYDVDVPFTDPTITWHISSIDLWPNGWPRLRHATLGDGDNLIPDYSTRLHYGGLVTLPDPDNQELLVHNTGHKHIVLEQESQSVVGAILTGYMDPEDARNTPSLFALHTPYTPPRFLVDNGDVILVFLGWSPADVLVTDPLGRSVGYDPVAGQIVNQIPGAFYTGNGADEEFILIPGDLEGDYTVTASGTGTGLYAVSAHRVDSSGVQEIGIVSGTIAPGQVVSGAVTWAPQTEAIFDDNLESGGGNWAAEGGWSLVMGEAHSPVTSWAGEAITPGAPLTLTLQVPLDLSVARWARLTFWYSQALSTEAAGVVELSVDGGEHWTAVAAHVGETGEWRRRTLDLTPFTEPGLPPLRLRFRLFPATLADRWLIDDLRVEALPTPMLFELPFQDDVEGWRKWDAAGSWVRTDDESLSPHLAWQADAPGAVLTLAGALDLREAVSPTLTFWYTMTTGGEGVVEVSTDSTTWQPAATITETTDWTQTRVELSAWAGLTATLRLRQTAGATWTVDDFAVRDVVPPVVHPLPFSDDMEAPTANWRAVNAWQPVTDTAHSGVTAWRGYSGDSALILVDQLDLSEAVSPTLSFWQRFALAEGSVGQVMASADGGLTWQPVLTVTAPISDWMQAEVDLSAYAEQEIGLAFYMDEVLTGTQGGQTGYIGGPDHVAGFVSLGAGLGPARTGSPDRPRVSRIAMSLLALPALAAPILAVVWRRRGDGRATRWIQVASVASVMLTSLSCIGYNIPANPYPGENRLDDVLGEVEPVVLAEREPLAAEMSPDGQWLIVVMEHEQRFREWIAIDLVHNVEHVLATRDGGSSGLAWLDNQHAVVTMGGGLSMLRVPDLSRWRLTDLRPPSSDPVTDLGILWEADYLYVVEGEFSSGYAVFSVDEDLPYYVSMSTVWRTQEDVETALASIPHTIIQAEGLLFDYNSRHYSPDGQYYVAPRPVNVPGDSLDYPLIAMFDAATEKEVAHAFKWGWHGDFRGWAYDSSGAYFIYKPWGVDAGVLHPRHPIYKLLVPGATPRGTPVPVSTPTPSGEGRIPGAAQLRPVGYRPAPVAQSGEQGWYVDDVSVFDAASSPYIFADDFDRPDSTDLGPDWVEEEGDWDIVSDQLHCPVTQSGCRVATAESFDDTAFVVETRLRATPLLQAADSTFPQLGRLGWWASGGPGHFYVDWVMATPGGAP
ncbi:MAG: hypothetical protein H5T62_12255 [Anaerolineae bacterium]|nr:hypothetical protein [Anaerolineae bacterium]